MALHGFSRSTVSTVSHQRRHHPCSSYAHRRKLTLLLPDPLRRCRKRRRPIAAALANNAHARATADNPRHRQDARHLVGDRHRHDPERFAFEKSCDPRILLRLVARPLQHRMGSDHQNASQILVASFRDRPELLFAAGRTLAAVRSRSRLQSRDPIEKSSTATGATTNAYRATTSPRTCAAWSRTGTPRAKRWRQRRPRRAADSRAADRTPEKHSR